MVLYLSRLELQARLHLGKEAQQWLGHTEASDYTAIQWLYLAKEDRHRYRVTYMESFDEGDEDWHQVPEFSLLDPDAEETVAFDSVEEAVAYAVHTYGASPDRFVPGGMLAEEYARYWQSKNAPTK